jgi:hypothetical protein
VKDRAQLSGNGYFIDFEISVLEADPVKRASIMKQNTADLTGGIELEHPDMNRFQSEAVPKTNTDLHIAP